MQSRQSNKICVGVSMDEKTSSSPVLPAEESRMEADGDEEEEKEGTEGGNEGRLPSGYLIRSNSQGD